MSAQRPRASLSPQHDDSQVLFTREDQHPSLRASGMVSFGGSEEGFDDSMSLAASKAEDWVNSGDDSTPGL